MTRRPDHRADGILAGPVDPPTAPRTYPTVAVPPGTLLLHRPSRFAGALVRADGDRVLLRTPAGKVRALTNRAGDFALDGTAIRVAPTTGSGAAPAAPPDEVDLRGGAVIARRTASGSRAVVGAAARTARASRILVEGVHDAELVERVWGDDLRIEGVVVERLDGLDHLADAIARFRPGPARRLGVLVDHLVPGSKEQRIAESVRHPAVLVRGTPYVDVWQAIRPAAVGIAAWPEVPRGTPWKEGVCAALGVGDPRAFWRRVLASVGDWRDLEQPLVRAVEELVDFVTAPAEQPERS
jgi:hypothetical protein